MFNGTSSASPIIAGVIADIQGIRRARKEEPWSAGDMLENIKGSPQTANAVDKPIGLFPDLRETIRHLY